MEAAQAGDSVMEQAVPSLAQAVQHTTTTSLMLSRLVSSSLSLESEEERKSSQTSMPLQQRQQQQEGQDMDPVAEVIPDSRCRGSHRRLQASIYPLQDHLNNLMGIQSDLQVLPAAISVEEQGGPLAP